MNGARPELKERIQKLESATKELKTQVQKSRNKKLKSAYEEFFAALVLVIDRLDSQTKLI